MTMRVLTLTQPYASLVALGAKTIETRSWSTAHRGRIAIHAARDFPARARQVCSTEPFRSVLTQTGLLDGGYVITSRTVTRTGRVTERGEHRTWLNLPLGQIVAVAHLHQVGVIRRLHDQRVYIEGRDAPVEGSELSFGDYHPGRYGWILTNVQPLTAPIPCRGALRLWQPPPDLEARVNAQLEQRGEECPSTALR